MKPTPVLNIVHAFMHYNDNKLSDIMIIIMHQSRAYDPSCVNFTADRHANKLGPREST